MTKHSHHAKGTHELGELRMLPYPTLSNKTDIPASQALKESKFFENNNDVFVNNPYRKHNYKK
jgi:hypothetical protein